MQLKNIVDGCGNLATIRLFHNYNKELQLISKVRLEICRDCKLFNNGTCDSNLEAPAVIDFKYYNEDRTKDKLYTGCSCNLNCKTLVIDESCPLGKWLSITI